MIQAFEGVGCCGGTEDVHSCAWERGGTPRTSSSAKRDGSFRCSTSRRPSRSIVSVMGSPLAARSAPIPPGSRPPGSRTLPNGSFAAPTTLCTANQTPILGHRLRNRLAAGRYDPESKTSSVPPPTHCGRACSRVAWRPPFGPAEPRAGSSNHVRAIEMPLNPALCITKHHDGLPTVYRGATKPSAKDVKGRCPAPTARGVASGSHLSTGPCR